MHRRTGSDTLQTKQVACQRTSKAITKIPGPQSLASPGGHALSTQSPLHGFHLTVMSGVVLTPNMTLISICAWFHAAAKKMASTCGCKNLQHPGAIHALYNGVKS